MKARLAALGVPGVVARDVPLGGARASSATSRPDAVGQDPAVEGARCSARSRTRCRAPYKFRPAGDLATEIEWAKNRRIGPDRVPRASSATTSRRFPPT